MYIQFVALIPSNTSICKITFTKVYIVCILFIYSYKRGTSMKIILKNTSEQPIYEQIKQQIKENILKGYVEAGSHLPSMRELAKDLQVSLTTVRGKGTFVKEQDSSILKEKQFFVIENLARLMIKEAKTIDMPLKELKEILALIYEEEEE